jgi:predicted phosphodiesterase
VTHHVVVLGDIHGNGRALRAALDQAARGPMDRLIFLGDLLTYGHDVDQVLDLVSEAQATWDATLLTGNHDQLYSDLARGERGYADKLPDWITESVAYTRTRLDDRRFAALRWSEELIVDGALFAHANPFGFGDWGYLNHPVELARAAETLTTRGLTLGVFGHTHRPKWDRTDVTAGTRTTTPRTKPIVANAGAVGQPRDRHAQALILRLELTAESATATFEAVTYDVAAHVAALRASGLSAATVDKLASFFKPT